MMNGDIKLAFHSIKTAKWRSFFTMLGIIIGVASVVVTVSLGEGVKHQISNYLAQFGNDLITVRPNRISGKDKRATLGVHLFSDVSTTLTDNDIKTVTKTEGVNIVSPIALVNGVSRYDEREYKQGFIVGVSANLPELINHKVQYGSFFTAGEETRHVAVLGQTAAQELFQENVPIGKSFTLKGEEFIVRGIFEEFDTNPITPGGDFNNAIFIPYLTATTLGDGNVQVLQIFAKPKNIEDLETVASTVKTNLKTTHDNQQDFDVFTKQQSAQDSSGMLTLITGMIAGVAGISLFVGGIGIMNVMLVSVSERTYEIGIRKTIGATNRQILKQFLTESAILSFVGSLLGVIFALIINFVIRITTELEPLINYKVVLVAVGVALVVGLVFGIAPAYRASRKDPIEAMRYQ